MADAAPLTLPERQLANEMAVLLTGYMWECLGKELYEGHVHNGGQSNFESGCRALNLVGIYQQGKQYTVHLPLVSVAEARGHMEALAEVDRDAFEYLLRAAVSNFVGFSGALSSTRLPFEVPPDMQVLAGLLAQNGYATWDGVHLQWTNKPAPQMWDAYLWDEDCSSFSDRLNAAVKANAQQLAKSLPEKVRHEVIELLAQDGGDGHAYRLMAQQVPQIFGADFEDFELWHTQTNKFYGFNVFTFKEAARLLREGLA